MKLSDFCSLYALLSSHSNDLLPARTAFAIGKFLLTNKTTYELYYSKYSELILKYCLKDSDGNLLREDYGYKIPPEDMPVATKEIADLDNYEIEDPKLVLCLEDLSTLKLTPREYSILIPYITE